MSSSADAFEILSISAQSIVLLFMRDSWAFSSHYDIDKNACVKRFLGLTYALRLVDKE